MSLTLSLANIRAAMRTIDPIFLDSRVTQDATLDELLGCRMTAKVETENPVGSFKGRGTELFAAIALSPGEALVCASAGNFGQGLARAAGKRGHACTVFAAKTANPVKIDAMRGFGADVRLIGMDFGAAKEAALHHASTQGLRFVEDGSESAIAEGAGTLALELPAHFDSILVQLGDGALLTGVATVLRELSPRTEIIAVVAQNAPAMKLSIEAGRPIATADANTIADGIAVRSPIPATLSLLRECCDDVLAVSEDALRKGMQLSCRHLGVMLEPAGAAGIAAILDHADRFRGQRVATILSGGNLSDEMRDELLRQSA